MANPHPTLSFVTFGMFILDEIEWQTPNPPTPKTDLIGGAGTYAVLGARLVASLSPDLPRTISWIVDVGSDFPPTVKLSIDAWNTTCIYRYDSTRLTTRAWNGYGANELRSFKYLTPKIRLEVSSLNPAQTMARSFHMVCSPERCIDITSRLREARRAIDPTYDEPVIVWEPIPDLCSPEELSRLQEAAKHCTVVSPNHDELKMFFPDEIASVETQAQLVTMLMGWTNNDNHSRPKSIVIIREGSNGSTAYFPPSTGPPQQSTPLHLPAYHTTKTSAIVLDPTGGGNTYLGALAMALTLCTTNALAQLPIYHIFPKHHITSTDTDIEANVPSNSNSNSNSSQPKHLNRTHYVMSMILALIAASFAIEQNGTPHLETRCNGSERERWNDGTMEGRIAQYLDREGQSISRG